MLCAGNANIGHTRRAIGRANAACDVVEIGLALGVVKGSPLLATELRIVTNAVIFVPKSIADTSSVSLRFVAESAIVSEPVGAVLPADWTDSVKSFSTERIAESTILFLAISAGSDDFSDSTTVSILPAFRGRNKSGGN